MRIRYSLFLSTSIILCLLFWYFTICFCGVYLNTNKEFLYTCLLSVAFSFCIIEFSLIFARSILWFLAKIYKNKIMIKCYALYLLIVNFVK